MNKDQVKLFFARFISGNSILLILLFVLTMLTKLGLYDFNWLINLMLFIELGVLIPSLFIVLVWPIEQFEFSKMKATLLIFGMTIYSGFLLLFRFESIDRTALICSLLFAVISFYMNLNEMIKRFTLVQYRLILISCVLHFSLVMLID